MDQHHKQSHLTLASLASCQRALTAAEVAKLLSLHKLTLYRYVRERRIPGAFYVGACLRFDPRKLAAYIEGRQ